MFRRFAVITAVILFCCMGRQAGAQEVLDGMAALVNDDVITFSQVRDLVGPVEHAARESLKGAELVEKIKEIRLKAINDLIDRQLILQEFKKGGYKIPDHYVEDRINTIVREEFGGDRSAFVRTLTAQGYTLDRFKQLETEKMIVQSMRSQMVKSDTSVPDSRVSEYYEKNRAEFTNEEQIKLRTIMISKGDDQGNNRRKMIEEIRSKIVGGAEFGDLALMYSEDSNQEAHGDWGWINRRTLTESLSKIAFNMKPGEVSDVVELGKYYYLLYVEAKKPASTRSLKEVRDDIEKKLLQEQRQKAQQEWIQKLRKKAYIKMF